MPQPNPRANVLVSLLWLCICLVFIDIGYHRVWVPHAGGQPVSILHWCQWLFWFALLLFWAGFGIVNFRRYQRGKTIV